MLESRVGQICKFVLQAESPRYPDLSRGAISFKQAKAEKKKSKQGKLL
jgi:hypothetical protein